MPKNDPTVRISRFLGVNNTEDPADLGQDETGAGWLVDALNIDLTNARKIQRRPGFQQVTGIGPVTSAYATRDERDLYLVSGGSLYRVDSMDPLALYELATGIAAGELQWAEAGNFTFFCGASRGIITGNEVLPFGIATPDAPGMAAIPGSLPAGRYLAACLYRDGHGREGGCGSIVEIDLSAPGGIAFDVPVLAGHDTALYVSNVNGDTLFHLADPAGPYNWTAGEPSALPLDEAQLGGYPPPASAECIAFHESRIWVSEYDQAANVSYIHPSKPFWYHLFPLDRYVPVPGRVRMLASVPSEMGAVLLIGTDERIHAYTADEALIELADYGVVPGRQVAIHDRAAYFWTERGLCRAMPFQNLTDANFSVPHGTRVGVGIRTHGGMDTLIISTDTGGTAHNPR